MKIIHLFSVLICFLVLSCNKTEQRKLNYYTAKSEIFSYQGRSLKLADSIAGLVGSASSVEFNAKGDSIIILVETKNTPRNYITISVNDEYKGRYVLQSDSIHKITLKLPNKDFNKIGVYKATEAFNGEILFHGVKAEEITTVEEGKKYLIEFIGDSITCGALSDDSDVPCDEGEYLDKHNAYLAYGPRIARDLNSDFILSSYSGIGIYRNWNDEGKESIMPQVYENLYLNEDTSKPYSFELKPDLVSICLGTNDMSKGDGKKDRLPFNPEKFIANYINFIKKIYSHYPGTKILLLNSPMLDGKENDVLVSCLKKVQEFYKEEDKNISIAMFDQLYINGCSYHPSIENNKEMATYLLPNYKEILEN